MQLTDLLAKCSNRNGVSPQNLTVDALFQFLGSGGGSGPAYVLLNGIDAERLCARASLIRAANQIIGHALPYLSLALPEECMRRDCNGSDHLIDTVLTSLDPAPARAPALATAKSSDGPSSQSRSLGSAAQRIRNGSRWTFPCSARRLRSLRRVLFNQTKSMFWTSILEATTTATALPQGSLFPFQILQLSPERSIVLL